MQPIFMLSADFPTLSAPSSPSCVVDVISPTTYCGPAPPRPKAPLSGELSPKVTERLSQIWYDLSVSAFRRATSPERGGFFAIPANFLYKFHKNPIQTLQPHTVHGTMTLYFPEMAKKRVPAFLLHFLCRRRGGESFSCA